MHLLYVPTDNTYISVYICLMVARRVALVSDCKSDTYAPPPIYTHTSCVWQLRWEAGGRRQCLLLYTPTQNVCGNCIGRNRFITLQHPHKMCVATAERAEHALSQRNIPLPCQHPHKMCVVTAA